MNEVAARVLMDALSAAFPSPAVSDATYGLYVHELERLGDEHAAQEAIHDLIRSSRFLPRIAEIVDAYRPRARALAEKREAEERERQIEHAQTHGLPRAKWEREPMPPETVEWLREHGIDVSGVLRRMEGSSSQAQRARIHPTPPDPGHNDAGPGPAGRRSS